MSDFVQRLRTLPWRRLVPASSAWLRLLVSPSSYCLVAAFFLTAIAKAAILPGLQQAGWYPLWLPWAVHSDALLYFGLAALFAFGEARTPRIRAATLPLALSLLVLATVNAGYLSITGQQLTAEAIQAGLERWADLCGIAGEHLRRIGWLRLGAVLALLVGAPLGIRALLVRRLGPSNRAVEARQRGLAAAWVALGAVMVWLLVPSPRSLPGRQLGENAALNTYWGWLFDDDSEAAATTAFVPPLLVAPGEIAQLAAAASKPNVVVLVWESTRYDFTSLAGPRAPARTPNLMRLAARGLVAPTARTVMPHTTKSLLSMLCARFPPMQKESIEITAPYRLQCLPRVLTEAGYRTGFFQSALGSFEQRPRLVDKLGYEHFEAWEDIGGQPLGYLASDDASLAAPLARWMDGRKPDQPFFATLLTSSTHHPYRLPKQVADRAARTGAPMATPKDRYARLVEHEDELLGQVLELLAKRGLIDSTLVVVLGDHGEGFGDKGVRQHDANFYEEGLRVPFVIAGPGVPQRQVTGNVSLIDLSPTLLHLLGLRLYEKLPREFTGRDLLTERIDEPRYFGCWYEHRCRGFVLGTRKVVEVPETGQRVYFELATDPGEQRPLPLPADLAAWVPRLDQIIESQQARNWPMVLGPTRPYGQWRCPANDACTNPRSPNGYFFEPP